MSHLQDEMADGSGGHRPGGNDLADDVEMDMPEPEAGGDIPEIEVVEFAA
jgi:hypothetical protein